MMGHFMGDMGWYAMLSLCRNSFPHAKNVSTTELAEKLQNEKGRILLLDARRKDEFDVSHLEGAVWVGEHGEHSKREVDEFLGLHPDGTIACYCSVGWRSSRLAQKLLQECQANEQLRQAVIVNVEGSIFKWANEGRPVWSGGRCLEPALVHPYNTIFGKLLDADKRYVTDEVVT